MSFLASALQTDLEFLVDDENSQRYNFVSDYGPAINSGIRFVISAFDTAFERNLLSPTVLSELLKITTFPFIYYLAEDTGVVQIDLVTQIDNIWRIVGLDPEPIVGPDPFPYISSKGSWAKYVPIHDFGNVFEDPFSGGHANTPIDLKKYIYTTVHTNTQTSPISINLILKPKPPGRVAIAFLEKPEIVDSEANKILLPMSVYQIILMKAYQYLMIQGGQEVISNLQVSEKNIQELIGLFKK
jgi:hypothetical protein